MSFAAPLVHEAGFSVVDRPWLAIGHDDGYEEQLTDFPTWVPTVLKGMRNRARNLEIVRRLLKGESYTWIKRSSGLPAWSIRAIQRRMVLVGVKCACGRALNHRGQCRERLKNYAPRRKRAQVAGHCRKGHPYRPEHRYIRPDRDVCRICFLERQKGRLARRKAQRRPARCEALALFNLVGRNGETLRSVRELIGIGERDRRQLQAFIAQCPQESGWVKQAIRYRKVLLEEFEKLTAKLQHAKRIAAAEAEAAHRAALVPRVMPLLHELVVPINA